MYFPKQKNAATYCLAKNTRNNNTVFTTLLSFKQSVIWFVSKMSTKEVSTQKIPVMRGIYHFRERKKGIPTATG